MENEYELTGSDEQIKQAEEIINRWFGILDDFEKGAKERYGRYGADYAIDIGMHVRFGLEELIDEHEKASYWIKHRDDMFSNLADRLDKEAKKAIKKAKKEIEAKKAKEANTSL